MDTTQATEAPIESQAPPAAPAADRSPPADTSEQNGGFASPYDAFSALPEFQGKDPLDIARDLYRAHTSYGEAQRRLQQYQSAVGPQYQEYMRNRDAYLAWQQSQQRPAEPEAPKRWFSPPEIQEGWKNYIVRDPATGREIIDPQAPFEAQQALRNYQDYTANFARKLVTDPENTLKPFIEQVAQAKAEELVRSQINQYSTENYVADLDRQNADWLYDESGNISPYGQAIANGIEQAKQLGIQGAQARWQYATNMLKSELLEMRYQQMQAQSQLYAGAQQSQAENPESNTASRDINFLRERAVRTPNRSAGSMEPRTPPQRMSFEDRLRQQLERDGVT